jgi:hypothetical protein
VASLIVNHMVQYTYIKGKKSRKKILLSRISYHFLNSSDREIRRNC